MGRRGLLVAVFAVALLSAAGCGGDGPPEFTGSDAEQIAGTVNAMTAAIAAGDGTVACGLMTAAGQQAMLTLGRQAGGSGIPDCATAVPVAGSAGFDPGDFRITIEDVTVSGDQATARCDLAGGFALVREDAGWRVDEPSCGD